MVKTYFVPELSRRLGSEKGLLGSLTEEEDRKPFPFILDIIDTPEYRERNRLVRQNLEEIGLKEGKMYGVRFISPDFGNHCPMPRLCVSKGNCFDLLPIIICGDKSIGFYLERFREQIQVVLAELRRKND